MTGDDMNDSDQELDTLLGDHFHRRLDGQRGRAAAALASSAMEQRRGRGPSMRLVFGSAGLIAASVAVAWALWPRVTHHPQPSSPVVTVAPAPTGGSAPPRELERLVLWQTVDDGAGVLGDTLPVRKLRQEGVQQVQFYLPDERATVSVTTPVVRNVMVQMETY
jgi:hypothetical protein